MDTAAGAKGVRADLMGFRPVINCAPFSRLSSQVPNIWPAYIAGTKFLVSRFQESRGGFRSCPCVLASVLLERFT